MTIFKKGRWNNEFHLFISQLLQSEVFGVLPEADMVEGFNLAAARFLSVAKP